MNLKNIIKSGSTIGISGHIRPDGDCIGSVLGLYHYINNNFNNVTVKVYLEEAPEVFHFLPGYSSVCHSMENIEKFDLYFALDCGDIERLGTFAQLFNAAEYKICIDHHKSNSGYGDENYIFPDASSTSELIFDLIGEEHVTYDIAQCLYVGIAHDTGIFQYNCTSPHTMKVAACLMEKGIPFTEIVDYTYNKMTFIQNRILGKAIYEAKLYHNGQIIVSVITKDNMRDLGATAADLDAIVNQLRITKGVEVAVFLYELQDGYKASLRGNGKVDLAVIAQKYNGGGHFMAAGLSASMSADELRQSLLSDIKEQLKE